MSELTISAPPASVRRRPPAGLRRLAVGPPGDPRWVRPALWAVLVFATALYAWGLSKNGYANEFYAAAVKRTGRPRRTPACEGPRN